jgi:predicted double-glycine peptidase
MKGCDKMETRRTSLSYSDYARGIKSLSIDEQLTLLEIISTRLKKSIGKRRKSSIMD